MPSPRPAPRSEESARPDRQARDRDLRNHDARTHEPWAFETDLERHRSNDDEVYGSHGVQPDADEPFRPGRTGGRHGGMSRVGPRRR